MLVIRNGIRAHAYQRPQTKSNRLAANVNSSLKLRTSFCLSALNWELWYEFVCGSTCLNAGLAIVCPASFLSEIIQPNAEDMPSNRPQPLLSKSFAIAVHLFNWFMTLFYANPTGEWAVRTLQSLAMILFLSDVWWWRNELRHCTLMMFIKPVHLKVAWLCIASWPASPSDASGC